MAENRRVTYLDTKAVVVYSLTFILKRHNLKWVGPKPKLPVKLSPCFYQILQNMLELYDGNFAEISQDVDDNMLENFGEAIENVGNQILTRCHLPLQPKDQSPMPVVHKSPSNRHLELNTTNGQRQLITPPNFMQSNVLALVYFAAVLAVKAQTSILAKLNKDRNLDLQLYEQTATIVNGHVYDDALSSDHSPDLSASPNITTSDYSTRNIGISPVESMSNSTSSVNPAINSRFRKASNVSMLSNETSSSYYRSGEDLSMSVDSGNSSVLFQEGIKCMNTIQMANKVSSFINRNMGYFIEHYGGWEAWVSISASGGSRTSMSNPQSPNLSEREQITNTLTSSTTVNGSYPPPGAPPAAYLRSTQSTDTTSTSTLNSDVSRSSSTRILRDANLTSLEDDDNGLPFANNDTNPSMDVSSNIGTDGRRYTVTNGHTDRYLNSEAGDDNEHNPGNPTVEKQKWSNNMWAMGVVGAGALLTTLLLRVKSL